MRSRGPSVSDRLEAVPHATVLAEGPRHRVVRYASDAGGPGRGNGATASVIAKFYGDGSGARTTRIMQAIHAALERSPGRARLGIPRPLGYDAERRLMLQEPVPGVRFDALLSGAHALESLSLAGRALATLHGLHVSVGRGRAMADHIAELIEPNPARLARALPSHRTRIEWVIGRLLEADALWRHRRADVPIHRDVHLRQLFLDAGRIWMIDWDLCARGDAALDVGNFVAYLRARRRTGEAAVRALLRGYAAHGAPDVLARAPLYEALTYVRLACKRFRLKEADWCEQSAALVARAEGCLKVVV